MFSVRTRDFFRFCTFAHENPICNCCHPGEPAPPTTRIVAPSPARPPPAPRPLSGRLLPEASRALSRSSSPPPGSHCTIIVPPARAPGSASAAPLPAGEGRASRLAHNGNPVEAAYVTRGAVARAGVCSQLGRGSHRSEVVSLRIGNGTTALNP